VAEQKRIVKSPAKAIALALGGVVGLHAVGVLAHIFLAYQMSLWEGAGTNLPPRLKLLGYAGGVALAVVVGVVAPPVGQAKRGREADVVKTYKAGEEPAAFPVPAHTYPEVTYRLWLLEPGVAYHVRVEKFGSAIEPEEPGGDVIYETYYHFTFR
jgi:hypothetical protein